MAIDDLFGIAFESRIVFKDEIISDNDMRNLGTCIEPFGIQNRVLVPPLLD